MTDDDLKALFDESENKTPSEAARARAKAAAMEAFEAAANNVEKSSEEIKSQNPQGNVTALRPIADNNPSVWRTKMTAINQRWVVSGIASAAVLVLTVSVLINVRDPVVDTELMTSRENAVGADSGLEEVVVTAQKQPERTEQDLAMADSPVSAPPPMERQTFTAAAKSESRSLAYAPSAPVASDVSNEVVHPGYYQDEGRDQFADIVTNPVKRVADEPVSTFSVDVDTASYSFVRRQLNQGVLPRKDAVRVEEMINYFDYDYPLPESKETPFKATVAVTDAPWKAGNKLIHIGIRGYDMAPTEVPASNLVFLLDVSGSMHSPDKLPLVKQSMGLLLNQLKPTDTVAIVAYAGAAGTVLEPTQAKEKQKIMAALEQLNAGGSTAGGEGIKLAYQLAKAGFDKNAVNRVILATDGDFNMGITDHEELKDFVELQREEGIYLSVLGFGQGNYHDNLMQVLAQNGNGVAAYIDTLSEAQKVLVDEATSTLFPIARDVKIQMEFNPQTVKEYRLLGYETRALKREDFNNDKVDAGDIGAGHRVTAIYEITPVGSGSGLIEPSRYDQPEASATGHGNEYGFLKIRYKLPEESKSKLITTPVTVNNSAVAENKVLEQETGFAIAVAGFAQLLRGGQYTGDWTYQDAIDLANKNKGDDTYGYRAEFVQLVRKASVAQAMK